MIIPDVFYDDKMGRWGSHRTGNYKKCIILTTTCRISKSTVSSDYMSKVQCEKHKKVKSTTKYCKEILDNVTRYIDNNKNVNSIIISGYINEDIYTDKIERFLIINSL